MVEEFGDDRLGGLLVDRQVGDDQGRVAVGGREHPAVDDLDPSAASAGLVERPVEGTARRVGTVDTDDDLARLHLDGVAVAGAALLGTPDDGERHRRVVQTLLAHRPHEEPGETAIAVRADDQERRVGRRLDEHHGRTLGLDLHHDRGRSVGTDGVGHVLLQREHCVGLGVLRVVRLGPVDVVLPEERPRHDGSDGPASRLTFCDRPAQRLRGAVRFVHSHGDRCHDCIVIEITPPRQSPRTRPRSSA